MLHTDPRPFGVMLDVSRNAVMTVPRIKEYVARLHKFGYNTLMLYTEDTYEIEGEPYFGHKRGRYSVEELREVVAFCTELGVEVIPCIQTLAHLATIFRWPCYKEILDVDDILMIDDERTYALIEKMFATLRKIFPGRRIHIGMDEAAHVGLGNFLNKNGYEDRYSLLSRHLKRICAIAKEYDFEPMLWGDMFLRLVNGGKYVLLQEPNVPSPEQLDLPEEVSLVYWDYYDTRKKHYDTLLAAFEKLGRPFWFAGGAWGWASFAPDNAFSLRHARAAMEACREKPPVGTFVTLWGDDGGECSFHALMPALFAWAAFYRGETDMNQIKAEFEAEFGIPFDDFCLLDIRRPQEGVTRNDGAINNPEKYLLYNDPFLGLCDSALMGGEGEFYARRAEALTPWCEHPQYGALFREARALCRVLSVKAELGVRTRALYKNGATTEQWSALLADYDKAGALLSEFIDAFRALWLEDNKPFGLEIHEIRLGGLLTRLSFCRKRLAEHAEKGVAIAELEEESLDLMGGGTEPGAKALRFPLWKNMISPNRMAEHNM